MQNSAELMISQYLMPARCYQRDPQISVVVTLFALYTCLNIPHAKYLDYVPNEAAIKQLAITRCIYITRCSQVFK